jgi:hypothetical protein
VQIGSIEIIVEPPQPPPVPLRRQPAAAPARLARGFASFGWTQS